MLFVFLLYSFAVIFIVILVPARWRNPIVVGWVIGLATGDCGFKPSRCTVECDLGQIIHTHICLCYKQYNLEQRKLRSKQAHRETYWPRIHE